MLCTEGTFLGIQEGTVLPLIGQRYEQRYTSKRSETSLAMCHRKRIEGARGPFFPSLDRRNSRSKLRRRTTLLSHTEKRLGFFFSWGWGVGYICTGIGMNAFLFPISSSSSSSVRSRARKCFRSYPLFCD